MDSKTLDELLGRLSSKQPLYKENLDYMNGKNPYIMNKPHTKKPDNRMPVTLGKMAVDAMAGYAGKAGNIKVSYDLVTTDTKDEEDPFIEYMRTMDDFNESELELSELYYEALQQGKAYEIFWTSEEVPLPVSGLLTTEYKIVDSNEVVLIWDRSLKPKLLKAVHFTKDEEGDMAVVYEPLLNETWERKKGVGSWVRTEEEETPFETVPVNIYKINRNAVNLFAAEKTYIDGIDEIYSKSMNEIDRFNAAIALFGSELGAKFAEEFAAGNISMVDGLASDLGEKFTPQYLEKDLSGVKDFYNQLMDRMETWFRKSVGIADFSDEAFAGQQSGIAIMFKLIPMEFRASQIETYFKQGINRRLEYYGDVYNASTAASVDIDEYTTVIKTERNIPVDEKAKVEILTMLQAIISNKTLLEGLPNSIVADVEKEIARKEEEVIEIDLIGGDDDAGAITTDGQGQN
jgi:SPP1 family phage portal protein